jgi:hypothetical protein
MGEVFDLLMGAAPRALLLYASKHVLGRREKVNNERTVHMREKRVLRQHRALTEAQPVWM